MQTLTGHERTAILACGVIFWWISIFRIAARAAANIEHRPAEIPAAVWAAAGAITALAAFRGNLTAAAAACVCIALLAGGVVDARTGFLVDAVTLPAAALSLLAALLSGRTHQACAGVLASAGLFACFYVATRGTGVGLGDVKALYAVGSTLGPTGATLALAAASLSGVVFALWRGEFGRGRCLRFGPHLAAGATFTFLTMGS